MNRIFRSLLIVLLALASLETGACAGTAQVSLSRGVPTGQTYMGLRLLGALRLPPDPIDGLAPRELSGVAWDEDEGVLYAISDDGKLFHLIPVFQGGFLVDVEIRTAYALQDAGGRPLRSRGADSEGLTLSNGANGIRGDSELIVSFEVEPRIERYSPTGKRLRAESLPALLQYRRNYSTPNKALEAVTLHHRWGLLTAPERPLKGGASESVPIFALDGRSWQYPLYSAPNSSLVGMEALPDGSLLILERAFVSLLHPLVIALRRTRLTEDESSLLVEDVAIMDTSQGWLLDNFEGLTHYRGQRFFMVSDDNRRFLQSTLLVCFELLAPVDRGENDANAK